ncbi:MAG: peptidylprolyl isomerase, partial [Paludibacteraceae bacterium]|nr:peptidylprolyl isomerase [Paludibacteraceae bacterium]
MRTVNLWTKRVLTACAVLLCLTGVSAQDNVIDEVIWVVGDEAILRSEVEEQRLRNQYEGVRIDGDPYCVIPEQIALQKLYLHQAELDSVVANENTVNTQVEMRLNYFITQIGSKEKMEEYFRKPMAEIREDMYELVHNQMVIQQMQQELVSGLKSTPAEIAKFYEQLPTDSIPLIPTQVEVQLITIEPPVPQEEIDRIKERLRGFAERVNNGSSSFSMLARLYSEDTQSATRGGELGFVGKGQLVPEFAAVAFALTNPNHVSRVVETEFGY